MTNNNVNLSTIVITTRGTWYCSKCSMLGVLVNNTAPLYCIRNHALKPPQVSTTNTLATKLFGKQDSNTKQQEFGETIYPGSLKTKLVSER